jgi:hypothetical protein
MRTHASRLAGAAAVIAAASVLFAAAAPAPAVPSSGWAPAGSITDTDESTFVGSGIAIGPGGGVIAWQNEPDRMTDALARFSASATPARLALSRPLAGATQLLALAGGGSAIGAIVPATHEFQLRFVGASGAGGRALTPGSAAQLPSQEAAIAAGPGGTVAVLGASGAQPVLTLCRPAGCGRPLALAPSTGTISTDGATATGTGLAVAVAPDGSVLAAWVGNGELQARWLRSDGSLRPTQRLARMHSQVWLAAAISAAGRAVLVWESQDDRHVVRPGPAMSPTLAAAASAPEDGSFGAVAALTSFAPTRATSGPMNTALSEPPVVAAAFHGTRPIVAWTAHGLSGFSVAAADLDAPAASEQTLSPPGMDATLGALVSAPGDGALAAWMACAPDSQGVCFPWQLQAAQAPAGGPFEAASTLRAGPSDATYFSAGAVAAIDPRSGRAWVAAASTDTLYLFSRPPA